MIDPAQKGFLKAVAPYLEDIPEGPEDTVHCNRLLEEKNAKTRQFFNSVAEDWDNLSKEVLEGFDLPQTVCDVMPERCRLAVDLGCGTGTVLVRMLSRAEGVVGVDGSQAMLDICRKRFSDIPGAEQKISLRLGGLDHLPLRDQEADFASINLVLHHLEELSPALAEARRILNGQGRLFISDFLRKRAISSAFTPVVTWKSERSLASCPSQYSLLDSIQSIFPYLKVKKATARSIWS